MKELGVDEFMPSVDVGKLIGVEKIVGGSISKVSSIVQNINGVKECSVDFEKGIATVVYDDKKIEEKDIVEGLITNTQYKAVLLDNNKTTPTVGKI